MKYISLFLLLQVYLLISGCKTSSLSKNTSIEQLSFGTDKPSQIRFVYSDTTNNIFLRQLRVNNDLLGITKNCNSDLEKLAQITDWTSKQWKHSGSNTPGKNDALTILKEAKEGKRFRCVEYGIVLSSALNAIGIKARVLGLKTRMVETTVTGAGHVLTEAFLPDLGKWVVADPQFNAIPTRNGTPLNAVEFQKAISVKEPIQLINTRGSLGHSIFKKYMTFIPQYLYYFDIAFDNRQGISGDRLLIEEKPRLMLVPLGAKNPTIFQIDAKIDYCIYTNSTAEFYATPNQYER